MSSKELLDCLKSDTSEAGTCNFIKIKEYFSSIDIKTFQVCTKLKSLKIKQIFEPISSFLLQLLGGDFLSQLSSQLKD